MYDDDQQVSLNFKALSVHPLLADDCAFLALYKPPEEMFPGLKKEMLPSIGVV